MTETLTGAKISTADLKRLIVRHPFGRYREDHDLPASASRRLQSLQIGERLRLSEVSRISVKSGGRTVALALVRQSAWDSAHFGFPFAIVETISSVEAGYDRRRAHAAALLTGLDAWLRERKVKVVTLRVPALDLPVVHALEDAGFRYIESWIYNKRDLRKPEPLSRPCALRPARPEDEKAMLACCAGAFDTQRFHADPRFGRRKAEDLYRRWIVSAFRDPKQRTLVHDVDGKPAAFMIYYENDLRPVLGLRFAMWKMALLAPEQRGQGLGGRFFASVLARHRADGFDVVDSGLTMRNAASLHLHCRMGFKIVSTMLTFHRWLK